MLIGPEVLVLGAHSFERQHVEVELRQDENLIKALHEYKILVLLAEHDLTVDAANGTRNWDQLRHLFNRI